MISDNSSTERGNKMARRIATAAVAAALSATISGAAGASEYQHNPYLNYSCKDLALAATDVARRAEEDVGIRSDALPNNAAGEPTIFWPKAFFANVSGEKASDLSHLKEEMISIENASVEGECEIQFKGPRPPGA
jgi:hypothetical protein